MGFAFPSLRQPRRSKNLRPRGNRLRTSRARAKETAGEAAARLEEYQRYTAAAREGERLDPVGMRVISSTIVVH